MIDNFKEKAARQEDITRIMTRLTEIWRKYPNLKLNQLLYYVNCMSEVLDTEFYYIDDSEFELNMERATNPGGDLHREESN
jgi:hypothetical protein